MLEIGLEFRFCLTISQYIIFLLASDLDFEQMTLLPQFASPSNEEVKLDVFQGFLGCFVETEKLWTQIQAMTLRSCVKYLTFLSLSFLKYKIIRVL